MCYWLVDPTLDQLFMAAQQFIASLNGISNKSENFWVGVLQHASFIELATSALDCLSTLISNVVVERIFSMVSSIKTKPRNRMELKLLDAIVRIRSEFLLQKKCCKDFFPSDSLISLYSKTDIYKQNRDDGNIGEFFRQFLE